MLQTYLRSILYPVTFQKGGMVVYTVPVRHNTFPNCNAAFYLLTHNKTKQKTNPTPLKKENYQRLHPNFW